MLGPLLVSRALAAAPPDDLASVESPKAAYDRGTHAWQAGEKERAAHWFARADALKPSDLALTAALRAADAAGLSALTVALTERARRGGVGRDAEKLATELGKKHEPRAGRLILRCKGNDDCAASVDGQNKVEGDWVDAGDHDVSWSCRQGAKSERVSVAAGARVEFEASCPEPKPAAPPTPAAAPLPKTRATPAPSPGRDAERHHGSRGLSPVWFWVGVGVTAALGAATTWSGLDTVSKHDDFEQSGRKDRDLKSQGESAQTRTNVLGIGTGVAAAATLGLGLFAVDFSNGARVGVTPLPGGPGARFEARF